MRLLTTRGYALSEVASALQKAIRRGDARVAGYFAIEMFESGYAAYAWRRLLTVSAEDCAGLVTQEIKALYDSWQVIHDLKKGKGRIFLAKAVIVLCQAVKSRDADHLTNLVYDPMHEVQCSACAGIGKIATADYGTCMACQGTGRKLLAAGLDEATLDRELDDARKTAEPIPDYAFDCHTSKGKKAGKNKTEFFLEEQDALSPRSPGLFDDDLEALRRGDIKITEGK